MLFQFRTPRTRDWSKYLKKLQKFLESNETTAHISAFVSSAQESRTVLVKLLDECAKDVSRPDDIIKVVNEYLPKLEQVISNIDANNVKLIGYLDIVWTSFLMNNLNGKSLSNTLKWEKIYCYALLGLAHYQKAVELHHLNRQISHKTKEKISKEQTDFDPIFDEPTDLNDQKPQIYDDQDRVKEISRYLKQAASIWAFTATLYPVLIVENGKNAYDVIPETFECVISVLSTLALINAQEFMVQLAVQTNKSHSLTAKLSAGVGNKLKKCNSLLASNLSQNSYNSIKSDFVLYLKIRSDLYQAIASKYNAKLLKQNEKHGECVAYYQSAISILRHATNQFPKHNNKNKNVASSSVIVIKKSINKQMQSVKALCNAALSENNSVYFEVVPKPDQIEQIDGKFVMKSDKYE
eukprot:190231_1